MATILATIYRNMQIRTNHRFWKDYVVTVEFVDPQNLGVDTKIRTIDAPKAEISHRVGQMAAILEICKLLKTLKPNCAKLFFWTSFRVI